MTSINPINVNTQGIGSSYGNKQSKESEEKTEEKVTPETGSKTPVSPDDVLSYMAQSAVTIAPKTIDTSKYVDKESEARIAGFMANFEEIVAANLSAIVAEFPEISENSQMALALASVDA